MSDAVGNSKKCQALTDSSTEQCNCWANQTVLMKKIKEFDCLAKKTQKLVTAHKNACIKVFSVCKKTEDASVAHVNHCMHDHSMAFINQSTDSLGTNIIPSHPLTHNMYLHISALAAVAATRTELPYD